jgi:hypothetical protein
MPLLRRILWLALASGAAQAQAQAGDEPWYAGGSLGLTRIDNLYRVSDAETENADTVRSATLLAGVQARLGRHRWKLDTRVSQNDYQRNSDLRNLSYSATTSWDWASGSRLSGQVLLGSQRSLAPFNPGNAPVTNQKNIERSDRARVYARYGLAGLWAVDGSVGANRRDYSLALYDRYDYSQRNADIGLRYQPSPPLGLRLASRHSRGSYPRHTVTGVGSFQADRFSRQDLDASLTWTPGPEHQVSLRISDGHSRHTEAAARDYRGRSGQLSTTWAPTSKLLFQAQLSRDTGDDSRLVDQGQFGSINSSNSRSYDSLQLQAVYSLTAKVTLDASLTQLRRELVDQFGLLSATGRDRSNSASLGARWAFDRNGLLSCQLSTDRRTGAAGFSLPFSASSTGCSLQYMLR